MKKNIILLLIATIISGITYSQKIIRNEKDDFTGSNIIETSYEKLNDGLTCCLQSIDNVIFLKVSCNSGDELYIMEENAEFMLKLEDGTIITLQNSEYAISDFISRTIGTTYISYYCLKTRYLFSNKDIEKLKSKKIVKVRFYTNKGYIDCDVHDKNGKKLVKLFNLI